MALTPEGEALLDQYRGPWSIGDAIEWLALFGTATRMPPRPGGRGSRFPGKRWRAPTSLKLSPAAMEALKTRAAAQGASRNELIEQLVRESGPALRSAAEAQHVQHP